MWAWLAVAVGGASGSVARHAVNQAVLNAWPQQTFPIATMIVNVTGSMAYGLLAGSIVAGALPLSASARDFIFVGVLGGFTTFSSFSFDVWTLIRAGNPMFAAANIVLQLTGGIGGLFCGMLVAKRLTESLGNR